MDAIRRAGVQWHPGNRPVVEFNGQESRSVNFMTFMSEKISPPLQFNQVCA